MILMFLSQLLCSGAMEVEEEAEPLNLELSAIVVMLLFSVLFVWESGRYCLRNWAFHDQARVRAVRPDERESPTQAHRARHIHTHTYIRA